MPAFNVNFSQLVKYILPVRLRGTIMQSWLNVLVSPVVFLYDLFIANRTTNLYRLSHNGQVVYLQAVLNDTFDATLRHITITDAAYADVLPVYILPELKPVALYTVFENKPQAIYINSEIAVSTSGFIVNVPAAIGTLSTTRMKSLIDVYRLVGMRNYSIVIV